MDEFQEVEFKIKFKVKYATAPTLLRQYGTTDVLECAVRDWDDMGAIKLFDLTEEAFLIEVSKVDSGEPTLVDHVKKIL